MNWINSEDRLPEKYGRYLVSDCGFVFILVWDPDEKCWCFDETDVERAGACYCEGENTDWITYWMPLPEAPDKQDE